MRGRRLLVAFAACATLTASVAGAAAPAKPSDLAPPEVSAAHLEWPLPNHDYTNSRATTDSAIDASNVTTLKPAWTRAMPGRGLFGNLASTPLILHGIAYVQDLESNIWALRMSDGSVKWKRTYLQAVIGPNGPAIGYGKLYAVVGRGTVVALDLKTGKKVWARSITRAGNDGVSIQPTPVGGLLLVSTVPANIEAQNFPPGTRGVLQALDVRTGKVVWKLDTVKGDLWGHPEVNAGGGAWYPPAVDLDAGIAYWGTGNPAPWPGTRRYPGGTSRKGPNLYSDSVLAVGLRDGTLRWYQQPNPHDLFDHDLQLTMLVDDANGRRLVIASGKLGIVLAYDARRGEPVWRTPVGTHLNDDLTELTGNTRVSPGPLGGVLTPMAAFAGTIYAAVNENAATYEPDKPNYVSDFALGGGGGLLVALDATTGAIKWQTPLAGGMALGGATVVNDLVLTATADGTFYGLNRDTGAIVFTFHAPGGINGWPAVAGDTILVPSGLANPPVLIALRLGG